MASAGVMVSGEAPRRREGGEVAREGGGKAEDDRTTEDAKDAADAMEDISTETDGLESGEMSFALSEAKKESPAPVLSCERWTIVLSVRSSSDNACGSTTTTRPPCSPPPGGALV